MGGEPTNALRRFNLRFPGLRRLLNIRRFRSTCRASMMKERRDASSAFWVLGPIERKGSAYQQDTPVREPKPEVASEGRRVYPHPIQSIHPSQPSTSRPSGFNTGIDHPSSVPGAIEGILTMLVVLRGLRSTGSLVSRARKSTPEMVRPN